ncbi:ABC transporter substrate-binding protein [Roseateles violae]|uniref:ABC transporter substrate-binding protein n=1 Tax=Roseateles violae TaxID=3058042 RepID=A0ABT8DKP5_9BURK|nr:ABC transporter substrate-binding protein [Pelomonas sp. PFR6]MDN3918980.1 ABC transporter substrate-binding protein [Pelomonas sp. PFR6]
MIQRRDLLLAAAAATGALPAGAEAPRKVLRCCYNSAEVGFDPPQVSDQTSVAVNAHIFESPLAYDALAEPARLVPQTAAALPEVSADFRRFVFTLKPGIMFADDPAFGGRPRELVAADYVYTIKRFYDPRLKTEHLYQFETARILGLSELRQRAIRSRMPFDYDAPVEGLRALDRYRFELRLAAPDPRFVHLFANAGLTGAVAREVVERYGADLMAHPVGTGPFRLRQWRRSSLIVLEKNPRFREQFFDAVAPEGDAHALAMQRHLQGKRLPVLDEVRISIIEEEQPRWLAFAGGELDTLEMPPGVAPLVLPRGRLAPHLQRRGVQARATVGASTRLSYFNFDDAQIGGYTPEKVALRRAILIAYDNAAEIRLVFKGQALPAQSLLSPSGYGYDPLLRSEMSAADPARARALLDTWGYLDRDGDGWRENPDGSPLLLRLAGVADSRQRQINELWSKQMQAIGLRIVFETGTFGELIKRALAGKLQIWSYSWSVSTPDGDFFLGMAYGPNAEQSNDARFRLAAYDRLYERQRVLPDGPERLALMQQCNRLMLAYAPYIAHWHAIRVDLTQPAVRAYRRHAFNRDWWRYADLV